MIDENKNSNFETIWQYDIEPKLQNLEIYRKKCKKIHDIWLVIGFSTLAVLIILSLLLLNRDVYIMRWCWLLFVLGLLLFLAGTKTLTWIEKNFRDNIKSVVLLPLLNDFGNFEIPKKDVLPLKEIKKLKLYKKAHKKRDDDRGVGSYKGIPIVILETELLHTVGKFTRHPSDITDFDGLVLKIGYNANKDQKEIATEGFVEKFKQFKCDFGFKDFQYVIKDGFLYIFIERPNFRTSNFFEVGNVHSTLFNKEIFQKNYNELTALFSLVDELIKTF